MKDCKDVHKLIVEEWHWQQGWAVRAQRQVAAAMILAVVVTAIVVIAGVRLW